MNLRKQHINSATQILRDELFSRSLTPSISIKSSSGLGSNALVPWIRFFDPKSSPNATTGWYVVILFPLKGDSIYLSLNHGTNKTIKGDLKREDFHVIRARKLMARTYLESSQLLPSSSVRDIELFAPRTGRDLAKGYEEANVASIVYSSTLDVTPQIVLDDVESLWECISAIQYKNVELVPGKAYQIADPQFEIQKETKSYIKDSKRLQKAARTHFDIQNSIAEIAKSRGIDPLSPSGGPDYDLAWRIKNTFHVVEVKSLPTGNEVDQMRIGIGQLLHYRRQLIETCPELTIRAILAVEKRPPTYYTWKELCDEVGITLAYGPKFKSIFD